MISVFKEIEVSLRSLICFVTLFLAKTDLRHREGME